MTQLVTESWSSFHQRHGSRQPRQAGMATPMISSESTTRERRRFPFRRISSFVNRRKQLKKQSSDNFLYYYDDSRRDLGHNFDKDWSNGS
eukprot:CAMPEP_0116840054 /NCGR_PEP_ID=MMETSP0418-20121206/10120_1 /TAXON_ID=1158023 /ORGANISM="Astrosyne radiata, Strain 13vi08-1A" /LENGTH=89 /DNA_ID=CAMNT_0004470255 /DNA_START=112 /DNA_END=381 /DNA_ORIENTATION=+